MENTQLKTIIEFLEMQDEKLNKLLEKSTSNNENLEINTLNKKLTTLDKNYKEYMKGLVLFLEFLKIVKIKIIEVTENIPTEIHQTYKFDKDSRNQVWLTVIGILVVFTLSIITINHFRDNTDYKKAWNRIYENNLTEDQKTYFNSLLDNSK